MAAISLGMKTRTAIGEFVAGRFCNSVVSEARCLCKWCKWYTGHW